mmetsp:Transcript_1478/g.1620  ORF Transcript_1478/g.1620 Transcript_1478/m.1620 type:complete len:322 (-) Transcript_1478:33-998(-)
MSKFAILSIVGVMALSLFLASSPSTDVLVESQFHAFVGQFGVNYASVEEQEFRFNVFKTNMEKISQLEESNPHATFGITQFSDRTEEEFVSTLTEFSEDHYGDYVEKYTKTSDKIDQAADERKYFQPIQNQASCGSCWTFAAAATFEAYKNKRGEDVGKLSEQELVDCVPTCSGCGGGLANLAYDWLVANSFCSETSYPYEAADLSCRKSACEGKATDSGSGLVTSGEKGILSKIQNDGPVSVSVDASTWHSYTGGILSSCTMNTNHAVVVVAFEPATHDEPAAWRIRNSWGSSYGEQGHIRVQAFKNTCNIEKRPSYPTF